MSEDIRIKSIQMPISDTTWVYIILDGPLENKDFLQLHKVVDLMREAYFPDSQPVIDKFVDNKRKHVLKKLPPCIKHPESPRNEKTNRCTACNKEQSSSIAHSMKSRVESVSSK